MPFLLADRADGTSRGGVTLGVTSFDESDSIYGLRVDASYQWFSRSGHGFYGAIPLNAAFNIDQDDSLSGVGNPDVGAAYARRSGQAGFVVRGGLTAPLVDAESEAFAAGILNAYGRLGDLVLFAPNTSYLRLSGSGILMAEQLFARADIGVDVPIYHGDEIGDPNKLTHVNLGVGTRLASGTALLAEFSTVSGEGDSLSAFSIGVELSGGFHAALVAPLDDASGEVWVAQIGFRFGSSTHSSAPRPTGSDCKARVAAWRADTDYSRKTRELEALQKECPEDMAAPAPASAPLPEAPTPSPPAEGRIDAPEAPVEALPPAADDPPADDPPADDPPADDPPADDGVGTGTAAP